MKKSAYLSLYIILDIDYLKERHIDCYKALNDTLKGGATAVQLRSKKIEDNEYYKIAIRMKKICAKYKVPFIINDRVDIAILINADGVHVGSEDLPVLLVKKIFKKIIGVSADSFAQTIAVDKMRASYVGVGPVFMTLQKNKKAMGLHIMKKLSQTVSTPIVAIGGINEYNIESLKKSGINNFSFISAVLGSKNIRKKTEEIKNIILS